MNKLSFGDVVLLRFPFTDGKKAKKRPALVLRDTTDGDVIVCRITSKFYNTEFDFQIKNWRESGLRLPSVIRLHKLASLDIKIVDQKMGAINNEIQQLLKERFVDILL